MKTFYCCLLLVLGMHATAQNSKPVRPRLPDHQLALNFNPLALLNPDQRLMFGLERRIAPRWSVVADAGLVVNSWYMDETNSVRGFELRPALRYYYGRDRLGYLQGQLHYRLVDYQVHDWLGKDCVNGVPTFEKMQDFTYRKQQYGAALVAGGIERLGKHWLLDVSVGLGLVQRDQKVASEKNCCYMRNDQIFGNSGQENEVIPVMPMAVKLAYVIK